MVKGITGRFSFLSSFALILSVTACTSPEFAKIANPVVDLKDMGPAVNFGETYEVQYSTKVHESKRIVKTEVLKKHPGEPEFSRYALIEGNPGKFNWTAPAQIMQPVIIGVRTQDQRGNWSEPDYSQALSVVRFSKLTETIFAQRPPASQTVQLGGECKLGAPVKVSVNLLTFGDPAAGTRPEFLPSSNQVISVPCQSSSEPGLATWETQLTARSLSPQLPYGQISFTIAQDHASEVIGRVFKNKPSFPETPAEVRELLVQRVNELSWHLVLGYQNGSHVFESYSDPNLRLPAYAQDLQTKTLNKFYEVRNGVAQALGFSNYQDLENIEGSVPYQVFPMAPMDQGFALDYIQFPNFSDGALCSSIVRGGGRDGSPQSGDTVAQCHDFLSQVVSKATFPMGKDQFWRLGIFKARTVLSAEQLLLKNDIDLAGISSRAVLRPLGAIVQQGVLLDPQASGSFLDSVAQMLSQFPAASDLEIKLEHLLAVDQSEAQRSQIRKSSLAVLFSNATLDFSAPMNSIVDTADYRFTELKIGKGTRIQVETNRSQVDQDPSSLGATRFDVDVKEVRAGVRLPEGVNIAFQSGNVQLSGIWFEASKALDLVASVDSARHPRLLFNGNEVISLPVVSFSGRHDMNLLRTQVRALQFQAQFRSSGLGAEEFKNGAVFAQAPSGTLIQWIQFSADAMGLENYRERLQSAHVWKVLQGSLSFQATQAYAPNSANAIPVPVVPGSDSCVGVSYPSFVAPADEAAEFPFFMLRLPYSTIDRPIPECSDNSNNPVS